MASQHSHVAKVIEKAAANPKSLMSGEAAALQAAANFVGCGPGPSMPLLPAPKVWHEALSNEGYSYYWNVETNGTVIIMTFFLQGRDVTITFIFNEQKHVGRRLLKAL